MKKAFQWIPEHVSIVLKRLLIPLAFLQLTRFIFWWFNADQFRDIDTWDILAGLWFDVITISLLFSPYLLIYFLPLPIRGYKIYRFILKFYFLVVCAFMFGLNLLDVEYYKYTAKRSTSDVFGFVGTGSDFSQLVTTFIVDFWFIILVFALLIWLTHKMYDFFGNENSRIKSYSKSFYRKNFLSFLIAIPLLIVLARGGLNLRPVGIIEAAQYTSTGKTAFILNTPFTVVKTFGQEELEQVNYMTLSKEKSLFNPHKKSQPQNILPDSTNVVILMLESFGIEFIGAYSGEESYTPFLDSLLNKSLFFEYGFSNGKKSIEAVPSIMVSIPSLMDNPYISSSYSNNAIASLPTILKENGYSTAFYHGATNGSMRFDSFAKFCGFEEYFGRSEYNNDKHFDLTWGILDEYFNPWSAKKMSKLKEPFFATVFTLSSHHPYFIPENRRDSVKNGPQPICASISYGDYALKEFFEEAKKQPWYDNTIFVICADHTPATTTVEYNQRTHMYRIPIAFYDPSGKLPIKRENKIFQQIDIMPTLLDLLNLNVNYYAFGSSYFDKKERMAIDYIEGSYYLFKGTSMMSFSKDKVRSITDFTVLGSNPASSNIPPSKKAKMEEQLRAIIQCYNRDLTRNQTIAK